MGGFNFIVAVIGLFGLGEIFLTVEEGLKVEGISTKIGMKDIWEGVKDVIRYPKPLIMGTLIGVWMGFKPGGATPASFMAYGFTKESRRMPMNSGKGSPPESSPPRPPPTAPEHRP